MTIDMAAIFSSPVSPYLGKQYEVITKLRRNQQGV